MQKQVLNDLTHHRQRPLILVTNHHRGMKSVLLSYAFQQQLKTMIIVPKKSLHAWHNEINKLYHNNVAKKQLIYMGVGKQHSNPYTMDYQIHITTTRYYKIKPNSNTLVILYKIPDNDCYRNDDIVILSDDVLKCQHDKINYIDNVPRTRVEHKLCYRNNTIHDVYLDSPYGELKPQHERLKSIIDNVKHKYEGPYLVIDDFEEQNINELFACKNIFADPIGVNDVICTYPKQCCLKNHILRRVKTIVYLWPTHTNDFHDVIDLIQYNDMPHNVIYVHSTVEERLLLKTHPTDLSTYHVKLLQQPRRKIDFLQHARKLLAFYTLQQLESIDNVYFYLLLMTSKSDLSVVERIIKHHIDPSLSTFC